MNEKIHWADQIAGQLLKNGQAKQVIVTGTSLSGEPHLGNANDVVRGDAIRRAVVDAGGKAELIWIADDMDPFRSLPTGFPEKLREFLGMPVNHIPDLDGCHKNFAQHFEEQLLSQLRALGVTPQPLFGAQMYADGKYNDSIKTAMAKRKEIIAILNKFREKPLEEDWQPINVICEKCKKSVTTKIISYDVKSATAEYECSTEEKEIHKTHANPAFVDTEYDSQTKIFKTENKIATVVKGCGHKGKVSILNGNAKLIWRVEWAARWAFLKATCEPFGKEHAAAGGSYDTGKEIVKLFGWNPPLSVVYEFFQIYGAKMSKSKGNVVTIPIMLEVLRPQELKFWMYYGKISKARDIDLSQMPIHVAEEFDKAERVFFGEKTGNEKDDANYKRAYELAALEVPKRLVQAPYTFCSAVVQVSCGREIEVLQKTGHLPKDLSPAEQHRIEARLENCRNWVQNHAPEEYRIRLLEKLPEVRISQAVKEVLLSAAEKIEAGVGSNDLQDFIYNTAKEKGIVKEMFAGAYQLFLGRDQGPRLGPFLTSIDKNFAVKRLRLEA